MLRLFDSRIESNLQDSFGFAIMHGSIKLHAGQ